jgi:hypothetical protein
LIAKIGQKIKQLNIKGLENSRVADWEEKQAATFFNFK